MTDDELDAEDTDIPQMAVEGLKAARFLRGVPSFSSKMMNSSESTHPAEPY
jgi:hypothetical protein